jgi:hypothetical protein
MNKRPLSVTLISWLFILVGAVTCLGDLQPLFDAEAGRRLAGYRPHHPVRLEIDQVAHFLALAGGYFMLRGFNWARWLLLVWMTFHIGIGALQSLFAGLVHGLLFAVMGYFLLRRESSAYFRESRKPPIPSG